MFDAPPRIYNPPIKKKKKEDPNWKMHRIQLRAHNISLQSNTIELNGT